jgi:hypothetical protein
VNEQAERAAVETEVQKQLATLQQQQAAAATTSDDGAAATTPGKLCIQSLLSDSHVYLYTSGVCYQTNARAHSSKGSWMLLMMLYFS